MRTFLSVWSLLDRRQRREFVGLQAVAVLMACSTAGGLAAVLPFFTVLAEPGALREHAFLWSLYTHWDFHSPRRFIVALGGAFATGVVLASGINLLGMRSMNRFASRVGERFHTELFDDYLHRSYAFHLHTNSAQLVTNVIHATTRATAGVLRSGLVLIANAVTIVCIAGSLIWVNPRVAIVTLVGFGACYFAIYATVQGRLIRNGRSETRHYVARTQVINESFQAIKELLVLQAQGPFAARFARYCRSISSTIVDTLTVSQSPKYVLEAAAVGALVGIALYLSRQSAGVGPWVGELSFIGFAAYRLLPAMQEAFAALVRIRAELPAFESIAGDLRSARARAVARARTIADERVVTGEKGRAPDIDLLDVSFTYSPDRSAAISRLSLRVPGGSVVALAGKNGSGKSTVLDLAAGLLEPRSGRVEIDGVRLDDRTRARWQASLAYVPQNIALLDASIAENIALGVPGEAVDREKVRTAAQLAQLEGLVATLPRGYDEPIGERGVRLSGGQRQRLGIARALYRDFSVLLMDEATSALDPSAERTILDLVTTRCRATGATLILVTHRASALRRCDVIYELADGKLVRRLTPEESLSQRESAVSAS